MVYNITVKHENSNLSYYDLCAQWNYNCYDNEILRLTDVIPSIEVGDYNITYPITFHPDTFEVSSYLLLICLFNQSLESLIDDLIICKIYVSHIAFLAICTPGVLWWGSFRGRPDHRHLRKSSVPIVFLRCF